jgi:uncharacterized membrane protein
LRWPETGFVRPSRSYLVDLSMNGFRLNLKHVAAWVLRCHFSIRFRGRRFELYLFCHGIPERSFFVAGHKLPICSRCSGVVVGSLSFIPLILLPRRGLVSLLLSMILIAPLVVDGLMQALEGRLSTNRMRFCTGFLGGVGTALMALSI